MQKHFGNISISFFLSLASSKLPSFENIGMQIWISRAVGDPFNKAINQIFPTALRTVRFVRIGGDVEASRSGPWFKSLKLIKVIKKTKLFANIRKFKNSKINEIIKKYYTRLFWFIYLNSNRRYVVYCALLEISKPDVHFKDSYLIWNKKELQTSLLNLIALQYNLSSQSVTNMKNRIKIKFCNKTHVFYKNSKKQNIPVLRRIN